MYVLLDTVALVVDSPGRFCALMTIDTLFSRIKAHISTQYRALYTIL